MSYTEWQLSEMMRDPRYWRDRDPEISQGHRGVRGVVPELSASQRDAGPRGDSRRANLDEMCMLEAERAETRFRQSTDNVARRHDEAMRMQALMFGAYMVGGDARERDWMCAQEWAAKAYREATGREW